MKGIRLCSLADLKHVLIFPHLLIHFSANSLPKLKIVFLDESQEKIILKKIIFDKIKPAKELLTRPFPGE